MDTRKRQPSDENTREQSNRTPFNVPPTPQRAPGRSGCPSETSIAVPERRRTSLPRDPRPQAAAARPSPRCSSSVLPETVSSARRKRLRGEREDRSCVQTREMRGQMDPSLKIPGAGGVWGQAVCQGRRELPGLGSLLLISSAMSFRAARQDRRGPCGLQPLPAHPSLWHVPPGGHPKGATASVPRAPSAPWWTQRTPTAMAATPPSSPGAGTPHPATGNWSSANTSLNRMGAFLTITAATDHGKKQKTGKKKNKLKPQMISPCPRLPPG